MKLEIKLAYCYLGARDTLALPNLESYMLEIHISMKKYIKKIEVMGSKIMQFSSDLAFIVQVQHREASVRTFAGRQETPVLLNFS